jgi:hypothetical protein
MHSRMYVCALIAMTLFCARAMAEDKHKHEHDHKAPHGGILLEVGEEVAHIELVHDAKAGKATLYILGADAKTAKAIKEAPKLNLKTDKGNKQLDTKAVGGKDGAASEYEASGDELKAEHLKGRIAIDIDGKKHNVDLVEGKDHHHH